MRRRLWFLLFCATVSAAGVFWVRWGIPRVERRLESTLPPILSRRLGRPARLERVKVHPLFLAVSLEGLSVSASDRDPSPLFTSRRWTLFLSPLHATKHFPWVTLSFGSSLVASPRVRLDALRGASGPGKGGGILALLPAHRVSWEDGVFLVPGVGKFPAFALSDSSGLAVLSAGSASAEIDGTSPWGPVHLAGSAGVPVFSAGKVPRWKAAVFLPSSRLEDLLPHLPASPPGAWEGAAAVSLSLSGDFQKAPVKEWAVELEMREGSVTVDRRPWPLSGRMAISPERCDLDVSALDHAITVRGSITAPLRPVEARLDLSVRAEAFPLEALRDRLPLRFLSVLPWRGTLTGDLLLKGSRANPEATLTAFMEDAGVGPVVFPRVEASLSSEENAYRWESSLAGGSLTGTLPRASSLGGADEWAFHWEGLSVDELARAGGWGPVGGRLGGDFAWRRNPGGNPLAGGVLRVEAPSWGDRRRQEPLIAYFSLKDGAVRFHNKDDTLDVVFDRKDDGADFHVAYAREDGMSVEGAGAMRGPARTVDFKGSLRQVSLRDIPFLLDRYPALEGGWSADVSARGPLARLALSAEVSAGGMRVRPQDPVHALSGRVLFSSGALTLEDLSLDGKWKGAALRLPDGFWRLSGVVDGGDAALFSEVLLSSTPVSGRLTGRLSAEGGGKEPWRGRAGFAWTDAAWGGFRTSSAALQCAWSPEEARLEHFSFTASTSVLVFTGRAVHRSGRSWDALLQGPIIEDARGTIRLTDGGTVAELALGDGLALSASADWNAKTFQARLSAQRTPAAALSRRLGTPWPGKGGGRIDGILSAGGPFRSPSATVSGRWTEARWNDISFSGKLEADWGEGGIALKEASLATASGGEWVMRGALPPRNGGIYDLSWDAHAMPMPPAPFLWTGLWNGSGSVSGSTDQPEFDFSLRALDVRIGSLSSFRAHAEGRYSRGVLTLSRAEAVGEEGLWRLHPGALMREAPGGSFEFSADSDLRNLHAGPLTFFGGLAWTGAWTSSPSPQLDMTLTARDLWINQQAFDHELARLTWSAGGITFNPPPSAQQRLTGRIGLESWPQLRFSEVSLWDGQDRRIFLNGEWGPSLWRFSAEGHGVDAGTLLSLADVGMNAEGPVDVLITGNGSAKAPRLEADVSGVGGRVEGVPYDRLALTLGWDGPRVALRNLEVVRKRGYTLTGRGEWLIPEDGPPRSSLFLRLTDGNLAVLTDLWPGCRKAKGDFEGELSLSPDKAEGRFLLDDASMTTDTYLRDISDLTVQLLLEDGNVLLENVTGRSGKGRFALEGRVGLNGLKVRDYDLSLRTVGRRGIPVSVPELSVPPGPILKRFSLLRRTLEAPSQGRPRIDLTVKGPHGAHVIAGEVVLDDTHFTYPPAKDAFKGAPMNSWRGEFWREATWDVTLKTGDNTWYRNEFVNVHVNGEVRLKGPRADMTADGRVAADQGVINYLSQPFQLRRALLELSTEKRSGADISETEAYLSGEAERTATTLDNRGVALLDTITMIIPRAPLNDINPRFVSRNNPGLNSERVFQRMLGFSAQDPFQPPSAEEQIQLQRAGLVQLVGSSVGPVANRLARLFGIDMISTIYEPTSPSGDSTRIPESETSVRTENGESVRAASRWSEVLRGAGASAGVRLSSRLFGLYKFKVDQTVQNRVYLHDEVQVVGRLKGNLFIRFSSELDTRSLLGQPPNRQALLEQQWRFGLPKRKKTAPEAEGADVQAP